MQQAADGFRVVRGAPAPEKGLAVLLDGGAVELDRSVDRRQRERHQPALPGDAEQEQVAVERVAHQAAGHRGGVEEKGPAGAAGFVDAGLHRLLRKLPVGVVREFGSRCFGDVDDCPCLAGKNLRQGFGAGGDHEVAADHGVRFAGGDARGMQVLGSVGDAQVRKDGAEFLRQAGHVENRDTLAVEVRGHAEQRAESDDAGTADAGDQDVEGVARVGEYGVGKVGKSRGKSAGRSAGQAAIVAGDGAAGAQPAAFDADETRAEGINLESSVNSLPVREKGEPKA
ncbi:MAG: hypothetical protein CAPSK01_002150 [Candidatus Accumulibacter vicinus]|uniref:Uncharacterized protein n=1 Tax=Candidatus Accumulibacter vicinus TaxID=2954382 RepID=A0A084Y0Q3_9PROT|nr:MAG: hypothetical protein CAPSK01_002150 [Candidatus Accumulibacter vicinus]